MDFIYKEKPLFEDRLDAGRKLASHLLKYLAKDSLAVAVPRGGVPVAIEVAKNSNSSFDLAICRKIPVPYNAEAGYGAVSEDGQVFLNTDLVNRIGLGNREIDRQIAGVKAEISRISSLYRQKIKRVPVAGKIVLIIDDGLASGYTMAVAVKSLRRQVPSRIIVASPVASSAAYSLLKPLTDDIQTVVIGRSVPFAVASFYNHWHDLTDGEVMDYLDEWLAYRDTALTGS
jgi:putative phosphoribosyl transferase